MWWHAIIETIFSLALFMNALLFIPQIRQLYKVKNAQGFSLITFFGFNMIQIVIILHGLLHHDILLIFGTALSLLTCGTITMMIVYYRLFKKNSY